MSQSSTALSKHERRQRAPSASDQTLKQLLVTRKDAAKMLGGISLMTLIRLEKEGLLKVRRLNRSPSAQVFYGYDNVVAVAQGGGIEGGGDKRIKFKPTGRQADAINWLRLVEVLCAMKPKITWWMGDERHESEAWFVREGGGVILHYPDDVPPEVARWTTRSLKRSLRDAITGKGPCPNTLTIDTGWFELGGDDDPTMSDEPDMEKDGGGRGGGGGDAR
jgi:hypothetical protein